MLFGTMFKNTQFPLVVSIEDFFQFGTTHGNKLWLPLFYPDSSLKLIINACHGRTMIESWVWWIQLLPFHCKFHTTVIRYYYSDCLFTCCILQNSNSQTIIQWVKYNILKHSLKLQYQYVKYIQVFFICLVTIYKNKL